LEGKGPLEGNAQTGLPGFAVGKVDKDASFKGKVGGMGGPGGPSEFGGERSPKGRKGARCRGAESFAHCGLFRYPCKSARELGRAGGGGGARPAARASLLNGFWGCLKGRQGGRSALNPFQKGGGGREHVLMASLRSQVPARSRKKKPATVNWAVSLPGFLPKMGGALAAMMADFSGGRPRIFPLPLPVFRGSC